MDLQQFEEKMKKDDLSLNQINRIKEVILFIGIAENLAWRTLEGVLRYDIHIENEILYYLINNNLVIESNSKYQKYPIYRLDKQLDIVLIQLIKNFQSKNIDQFLKDFQKLNQNILSLIDGDYFRYEPIEKFEISKLDFEERLDYRILLRNSIYWEQLREEFNKNLFEFKNLIQKYKYYFEITPFQSNKRAYEKFKFINDTRIKQILLKNENDFKSKFGLNIRKLRERDLYFQKMHFDKNTQEKRKFLEKSLYSEEFNKLLDSLNKKKIITPIQFDEENPYYDIIDIKEYTNMLTKFIQNEIDINTEPIINYLLNPSQKSMTSETIELIGEKEKLTIKESGKGAIIFISYATKDGDLFKIPDIAEILTSYDDIEDVLYWEENAHGSIIEYMEKSLEKCSAVLLFCSPNAFGSEPVKKEYQTAQYLNKKIIPIFYDIKDVPLLLRDQVGVKFDPFNFEKNIDNIHRYIPKISDVSVKKSKDEQEKEKIRLYGMIKLKKRINLPYISNILGINNEDLENFIFESVGSNKINGVLQENEFEIFSDIEKFIELLKEYLNKFV